MSDGRVEQRIAVRSRTIFFIFLSCFSTASRLHVRVADKAALASAAARFCSTHRLKVIVADKAALALTATCRSPTVSLSVRILNKSTLSRGATS